MTKTYKHKERRIKLAQTVAYIREHYPDVCQYMPLNWFIKVCDLFHLSASDYRTITSFEKIGIDISDGNLVVKLIEISITKEDIDNCNELLNVKKMSKSDIDAINKCYNDVLDLTDNDDNFSQSDVESINKCYDNLVNKSRPCNFLGEKPILISNMEYYPMYVNDTEIHYMFDSLIEV